MGIHVLLDPTEGVKVRLTFQSVSDPVRILVGKRRGQTAAIVILTVVVLIVNIHNRLVFGINLWSYY